MESMRGSGYTMASALADIIDNSISAGAKTVWVQAVPEREGSEIVIRDDGHGMSQGRLIQAMTLAAENLQHFRGNNMIWADLDWVSKQHHSASVDD